VKRVALIKHLKNNNCFFLREGTKHSIYINVDNNQISAVPRHRELKRNICRKICKDLEISSPF